MSTSLFPVSLDSYTNPTATNTTNNPSLSAGQTLQNDSLLALEAKVGTTGSTVASSLDYKIATLTNYNNALLTDTGSANTYVLTPSPALTAYSTGQKFNFIPANTNTAASTLNVNALGTKTIQHQGVALTAGYLLAGVIATVFYDGTQFQLITPALGAYQTWTPNFGGVSASPTVAVARFNQIGSMVHAFMEVASSGTSSSTTKTITLPVAAKSVSSFTCSQGKDGGVALTSPPMLITRVGTTTSDIYKDVSGAPWTSGGGYYVSFNICYEATNYA